MAKFRFLMSLLCIAGQCSVLSAQISFFVSPDGKDTNDGSVRAPFRSIEKAKHEARKQHGTITIYLRQGKYFLTRPLVFTPEDGGEQKQLTVRSYPGEQATLTGGIPLEPDWQPHKGNIMKARVSIPCTMDMLLVNGVIRPMARYPDFDSTAVRLNGTSADATSPERIKKWKNPAGGYLHAMHSHDWGDFHFRIIEKEKTDKLKLEGGWQNNRPSGLHPHNRMVENIFEELDAPGEWYYDTKESILYYYPMPHEDITVALLEAPQLKHLIEFRGSEQSPVRNITIQDIAFTQTIRTFMERYEPLLRSDWTIYRGGAIFLEGTENCAIKNCDLHHLGGNALFFSNYNRNSSVSGCHFFQIGASAICFVGNPKAVRSPSFEYGKSVPIPELDRTPGPANNDYPAYCSAYDNLIHHIGLFEKQTTGIELSMCRFITVGHNSIYHTPRAGINISEGTWGGHIIEYNDVFDTVKETGDHGAFNSWGRDRFWRSSYKEMARLVEAEPGLILADASSCTVIRNNRFKCDRGWDIDLDDGSSNYHIYNNLCLNGGIKLREGFYRTVENNIMINCTFHPHVWFRNSGDVFARNIIMEPYRPIGVSHWGTEVDYNLFTDSTAYVAARKNGTDEHSIVYPVTFCNPLTGDFKIKQIAEISPLCGFRNFETDRFGVISPRLRSIAKRPQMPHPAIWQETARASVLEWSGLSLKNLETLGERSATGMDSERGVYVISVRVMGNPLRDFIHANDVILKFDKKTTNNLADLKQAIQKADLTRPIEIVLFRNQREYPLTIPGNTIKQKIL